MTDNSDNPSPSSPFSNNVRAYRLRARADRLRLVYHTFRGEIDKLVNSSYPEEVKQHAKQELIDAMKQMFKQC